MRLLLLYILLWVQGDIPFKPAEEFQVHVEVKFKNKPAEYKPNTFDKGGQQIDTPTGGLGAFIVVNIVNLKIQPDESKIVVKNSNGIALLKKKTSPIPEIKLELGFADDMKTKTTANEFTVYFLSHKKDKLRKIVLTVEPDGNFLVNGKWHGKF
ncbi:MAG: hypothetical protein JST48_14155 [Bacteroidetes bacterium]|nr:hypothetical protein [Bacteroidota bacterium]